MPSNAEGSARDREMRGYPQDVEPRMAHEVLMTSLDRVAKVDTEVASLRLAISEKLSGCDASDQVPLMLKRMDVGKEKDHQLYLFDVNLVGEMPELEQNSALRDLYAVYLHLQDVICNPAHAGNGYCRGAEFALKARTLWLSICPHDISTDEVEVCQHIMNTVRILSQFEKDDANPDHKLPKAILSLFPKVDRILGLKSKLAMGIAGAGGECDVFRTHNDEVPYLVMRNRLDLDRLKARR